MTQQVFSEFIGIGAATLSSIFNGRTRPTLNIVEAIKKKIPNISTDWLMFGVGDMYLSESSNHTVSTERDNMVPEGNEVSVSPMLNFEEDIIPTPQTNYSHPQNYNSVKSTRSEIENRSKIR